MISIVIILVLIGVVMYFLERMLPMDGNIRMLIRVVVFIGVILWLLSAFGVNTGLHLPA